MFTKSKNIVERNWLFGGINTRHMTLILWYSHLKLSQHINYLKYCFLTLKPMYSWYWISQLMGPEWTASTLKKFNGLWIKVVFLFFKINRYISSTNCFTFFTIFRCLGLSLLKSLFVCLFTFFKYRYRIFVKCYTVHQW